MSVNRRSFLKSGSLSALTAAIGLVYAAPALGQVNPKRKLSAPKRTPAPRIPFGAEQSPLFYFTQETFQPYIGCVFIAHAGRKSVSMTLVEVTEYTPKASSKLSRGVVVPTNSFGLTFTSAGQLTDLTSIYTIQHGALGEFPLFLTRRDGPDGTSIYEAVFNHVL